MLENVCFLRICIQSWKQCFYDPQTKNLKIISMVIQNPRNSLMAALSLKNVPNKGSGTKNYASFKYVCFWIFLKAFCFENLFRMFF